MQLKLRTTALRVFYQCFPDYPDDNYHLEYLFKIKKKPTQTNKQKPKVLNPKATASEFPWEGPEKLYF